MTSKTIISYNFWDRHDVKGSEHMQWTDNTAKNIEPTGRWRFRNRDGSSNNHTMEIEIVYTQSTEGTVDKERKVPFLKYFSRKEEYDKKEIMEDHGRTNWVLETDISFTTINTYECANMGEE